MNAQPLTPRKPQAQETAKTPQKTSTAAAETRPVAVSAALASTGRKEVFFELDAASAKEVLLAGDFTAWEKTPIKLCKGERGSWKTSVKLAPGQYRYRFVVDGQWQDDPRASVKRPNPFGTSDCLIEIN